MKNLVNVSWLMQHIEDANLRILDCSVIFGFDEKGKFTFNSAASEWDAGHIPGSAFVDLMADLSDTDSEHKFTLPAAEKFSRSMGLLGVDNKSKVVLYDRDWAMWSTRVWWMLRYFGFDNAYVLDGGWNAWKKAGGELSTEISNYDPVIFSASAKSDWFVDRSQVEAALESADVILIDALPPETFRGDHVPYARPGHIVGAININSMALIDPETSLFINKDMLLQHFEPVMNNKAGNVIAYCGEGIGATAVAFLLNEMGMDNVSVYDGSLSEWAADKRLPMSTSER